MRSNGNLSEGNVTCVRNVAALGELENPPSMSFTFNSQDNSPVPQSRQAPTSAGPL